MTAGLSHGIPGYGSSICPGPISGSLMHNANSTMLPSGGGARPAMRSGMMCGEPMEPMNCPFCSPPSVEIVAKNSLCYAVGSGIRCPEVICGLSRPVRIEGNSVRWYTSCSHSARRHTCPFPSGSVHPYDRIKDRKCLCPPFLSFLCVRFAPWHSCIR